MDTFRHRDHQPRVWLGIGLHNEPAVRRVAFTSPTSLISEMVKMITHPD